MARRVDSDQDKGQGIDVQETQRARLRYNRMASRYDAMEARPERRFGLWRRRVWSLVQGPEVLEIGVGTGKNMPYYPPSVRVTGVDLSDKMLERARSRANELGLRLWLVEMDAQRLAFADNTFDSAVATFVFCSIPDPILGLREVVRVVKPEGRIVLLEHVRSTNALLGLLMDLLDPFVVRMMGPHVARRTVSNVQRAPVNIERVEDLWRGGIFKLIVARKIGTEERILDHGKQRDAPQPEAITIS